MSDTTHLRTRRERSGAPYAFLGYHVVAVWVVWNNYCLLFVWHFAMTAMSRCWRYLFVGIALMARLNPWPVGIDHCSMYDSLHGNVSKYEAGLRNYLDTNLRANKCVIAINIGLKSSNDLYTCFKCDPVS